MTPEVKQENRIVEGWLLFADERRRDYERLRADIEEGGDHPGWVMVGDTVAATDPTGMRAAKLAELHRMEQWLALVDEVECSLPPKMQVFLRVRRECRYGRGGRNGRPAWIPYVQRRYAQEIAHMEGRDEEDVWINRPETFWWWWQRIVEYAARLAAKRGLLE